MKRIPATDDKRAGKYDRTILYKLSTGRISLLRLPDETFSEAAVITAVRDDQKSHASITAKKFTL